MKRILLLLLLTTFSIQAQTLQNPTYGNVKLKNNTTDNSATKVNVQSTDGTINTISKSDLVNVVEVNDVPTLPLVGEVGKIYVVKNLNKIYRWNGTFYQELALKTLGYYNVKEFGAVGDNITDDTASIQSALNAAYDNNGGTVYFPNGIYKIGGALQSPNTGFANVNSQLTIKNTATGFLTIKLLGETPPAQIAGVLGSYAVNTSGVVLNSTIQGTGLYPSILSTTGLVGGNYINAILLEVENIEFRVKANIATGGVNMSALNASNILNVNIKSSFAGLDTSTNLSVYPTAETFGFYMPRTNLGQSSINDVAVTGFKVGYVFSEHNMGDLITAVGCEYAFYFADSYHPNSFNRLNSAWCKFPIGCGTLSFPNIGSNQSSVHIQQLDIEWQNTSYGNWFDTSYTINDATSHLKGYIEYQMVERNIGINNAGFSKNGGTKIQAIPLGLNHLPLNGGVLEKYNATVSNLLNVYNPNGNNGVGASILLGTSLVEGNGNARITGTSFSGNDYRSQLRLQTTKPNGTWNEGIFIDENGKLLSNNFEATGTMKMKEYTVATLPTPTGTAYATVTDALAPTYMATVVGGGAVVTPVFYNGTAWVSH